MRSADRGLAGRRGKMLVHLVWPSWHCRFGRLTRIALWVAGLVLSALFAERPVRAAGDGIYRDSCESSDPSWYDAGSGDSYRVESQIRATREPHGGRACEQVELLIFGDGALVDLAHDIGRASVIDDLACSVWVRAGRASPQLLARVVLPETPASASGEPLTMLIEGSSYTASGSWQQLTLFDVVKQVESQVRVLRASGRPSVNIRGAFVDQVVLRMREPPGRTRVWIDDLEIQGLARREIAYAGRSTPAVAPKPQPQWRHSGEVLELDRKPFFPRVWEYQGEPLSTVRDVGFNAILVPELPDLELRREARRLGIWIITPPPEGIVAGAAGHATPVDESYDAVLAWTLGRHLSARDLPAVRSASAALHRVDPLARPIVCAPENEVRAFSRQASTLLVDRGPLGTSWDLSEYGLWLRDWSRMTRPGTPIWTVIQTEYSFDHARQWEALGAETSRLVPPEQIRLLTWLALAAGTRGVCAGANSPLDDTAPKSRARWLALKLLNLELELIQPWVTAGAVVDTVESSEPGVIAAVIATDRTRLLLPMWIGKNGQLIPGQSAATGISFTVAGMPETNVAYEVTFAGLRPLRRQRVTGGLRVTLDEFEVAGMILLTQDSLAVSSLTRQLDGIRDEAARLAVELAARRLADWEVVRQRLARVGHEPPQSDSLTAAARQRLSAAEVALANKDFNAVFGEARRAVRMVRLLERSAWEDAVAGRDLTQFPQLASLETLPNFWIDHTNLQHASFGPNELPNSDLEDLTKMLAAGWRHLTHRQQGITSEANLDTANPHQGKRALRLKASQDSALVTASPVVESPPAWVVTPDIPVRPGETWRISGWIRIDQPIVGAHEGLLIVDSLGGEPLAYRARQTDGWQPFTLIRKAVEPGYLRLSIVLCGLGEAQIDDLACARQSPAAHSTARAASAFTLPRAFAPDSRSRP